MYYNVLLLDHFTVPGYNCRFMKDSYYRGSILCNLVNYKDNTRNLNLKEIKTRLITKDYFANAIFESTPASSTRYRQRDFVLFFK